MAEAKRVRRYIRQINKRIGNHQNKKWSKPGYNKNGGLTSQSKRSSRAIYLLILKKGVANALIKMLQIIMNKTSNTIKPRPGLIFFLKFESWAFKS